MTEMKKDLKLSDIPKHNMYQVPEGYFDRLPMRVMERTATADAPQGFFSTMLWKNLRVAIAPLILLLVFAGIFFMNTSRQQEPQFVSYGVADIPETEIMDYLHTFAQLESNDFVELSFTEQDLTSDFMNISPKMAEEELEYHQLEEINL